MEKHTPGPWKAISEAHYESGLTYTSVQPVTPDPNTMRPLLMANGEYHVCRMSHTAAMHKLAVHQANARLIAAAPEMLQALDLVVGSLRWDREDDFSKEVMRRVNVARAKAGVA